MLAYRHAFHVGNAADVLKHIVLIDVLERMGSKDKGYLYVDTHAGAGRYRLADRMSERLAEWRDGVGRLWGHEGAPPAVVSYLAQLEPFNRDGVLRVYPGSPAIAANMIRPQDRMCLFELHPTEYRALRAEMGSHSHIDLRPVNGFAELKSVLPPPSRRAVVLVDPPYEIDADYAKVIASLRDAVTRFATGVYLVWYPRLQSLESVGLPKRLKALAPGGWLHAQLTTTAPRPGGFGLMGSGMFVLNPPFGLREALEPTMAWLARKLGQDGAGACVLEGHQP